MNIHCKKCQLLLFLLLSLVTFLGLWIYNNKKVIDTVTEKVITLEKFEKEANNSLLNYISANWIGSEGYILSICTRTGFVTIEDFKNNSNRRYKILKIDNINGMLGFIVLELQTDINFDKITAIQINKMFNVDDVITVTYSSLIDECKDKPCTKIFKLFNRPKVISKDKVLNTYP